MNIKEIVQQVKGKAPEQYSKLPEAPAVGLLREAFAVVLGELESTDNGVVKIAGLGAFRIRLVDVEAGGKPKVVKRVMFIPVKTKA